MTIMPPLRCFETAEGSVAALFEPGERPPVVLLHGNSADHTTFSAQVAALRRNGFGVLAVDLPGHGRSENAAVPSATYSFPGYADAVGHVIDALAVDQVHVAGWSLGGHVGLELMGRDERVRSLFIWGTPPIALGTAALEEAFLPSEDMDFAGRAELDADQRGRYARAMVGHCPVPDTLAAAIARTDAAARSWMMKNCLAGCGLDERALVERDPRPVAILHGSADPFVRLSYLQGIAYRNLWRGTVQVLSGVGHAPHLQAPDVLNAALLDFLLSASGDVSSDRTGGAGPWLQTSRPSLKPHSGPPTSGR